MASGAGVPRHPSRRTRVASGARSIQHPSRRSPLLLTALESLVNGSVPFLTQT